MKRTRPVSRNSVTLLVGVLLLLGAVLICIIAGHFLQNGVPLKYESIVEKYSREYQVSEPLIYAVIRTESDFDPQAVSSAGAMGLMQMTPETFAWLQSRSGESLPDSALLEPETSIRYGVYFLSILSERFEVTDTVLAAYNAGMNAVASWLSDPEHSADGKHLQNIPYPETEYYVIKVNRALAQYRALLEPITTS